MTGRVSPRADASTDRLDALLEQRFSGNREAMARQLAEHDRQKAPAPPPPGKLVSLPRPSAVRGKARVRFAGTILPKLQELLKEELPGLAVLGARLGLGFTSAGLEFRVYDRSAYEAAHGAIGQAVSLPASSYVFNALYRHYEIRLVLPPAVQGVEQLLAVFRTVLTRLYGDVFLREEIYVLAPYKDDEPSTGPTVGLTEQIQVLGQEALTTPDLDRALAAFAQDQGLNLKRAAASVRKAFFADLEDRAQRDDVPGPVLTLVQGVFQNYLKALAADLSRAVHDHIAQVEALNRQITFLPPHEWPQYFQLKDNRPVHFLRAAKLRLELTIEAMAAFLEDFDALEDVARTPSPLVEERVQGFLQTLEAQRLARAYLVPGARLSDELQGRLSAFPLEVHEILIKLPPTDDPSRQFEALSTRMRNALHQRLYHAFVLLRQALRHREAGKGEAFRSSPSFQSLKAHAANFRLRLPMLRSLFARLGVVVDLAETSAGAGDLPAGRMRFPLSAFTRAWGQFAAHTVAAHWLGERRIKGFDPATYWSQVDSALNKSLAAPALGGTGAAASGAVQARLVYLLRQYVQRMGAADLSDLVAQLKGPSGTFRFAISQATQEPKNRNVAQREALEEILGALIEARKDQEKHALQVGLDGKLH